jgi:hypothetical protein
MRVHEGGGDGNNRESIICGGRNSRVGVEGIIEKTYYDFSIISHTPYMAVGRMIENT